MTEKIFMSPLADPVVGAIFNNVEQAGLAAQSLVGSILAAEGIEIGTVVSVTPQKITIPNIEVRATRVDVFIEADSGERILVEVQMFKEPLLERNILAVSQDLATTFAKGSNAWELRRDFPTVYVINIMNYIERRDNDDFIQPIMLMYTKPPHRTAFENLKIYNVELPAFRKKQHDLTKKLDAWLYILDTAEQKGITVEEVITMDETLRNTVTTDSGLSQFVTKYDNVTADEDLRQEYFNYVQGVWYLKGIKRSSKEDGKLEVAYEMICDHLPIEKIIKYTGLPLETIRNLSTQQSKKV
jgi:predicted transposase/invertase (TIGR01784 family)